MRNTLRSLASSYITLAKNAQRVFIELKAEYPAGVRAREAANIELLHGTCASYCAKFARSGDTAPRFVVRASESNRSAGQLTIAPNTKAFAANDEDVVRAKNAVKDWKKLVQRLALETMPAANKSLSVPRRAQELYRDMLAAQSAFDAYLKANGLDKRDVVASIKAK